MPAAFKKPCAGRGCPALVVGQRYCDKCKPQAKEAYEARRKKTAARGYGGRWQRLRKMILNRDPICNSCGRESSTDVDHITPKARGGTDDPANLQGLCHACHSRKTATQDSQFARRTG